MPMIYQHNEGDAVAINSNYAVQSGLNPDKDSIALQKSSPNSPYNNILVARKDNEHSRAIRLLLKALQSKETQQWIKNKYHGAVLPAGNVK